MHSSFKAEAQDSVLLVVDMQDKLLRAIDHWQDVLAVNVRMAQFANTLDIPMVVTEQYPQGLGTTNQKLQMVIGDVPLFTKMVFSCFGSDEFTAHIQSLQRKQLIIIGIEAHICVTQTALEALERGYQVHIVADAVGSRASDHKQLGLEKLRQAGACISSSEMVLYEWLERAGSPAFKKILPLIK